MLLGVVFSIVCHLYVFWFLGVVSDAISYSSTFGRVGTLQTWRPWFLASNDSDRPLVMVQLSELFLPMPRFLHTFANRTVLCHLFWSACITSGFGGPSLFGSFWSLSSYGISERGNCFLWFLESSDRVRVVSSPGGVDDLLQRWPATVILFATSLSYRRQVSFSPSKIQRGKSPMPFCSRVTIFWLMSSLRLF